MHCIRVATQDLARPGRLASRIPPVVFVVVVVVAAAAVKFEGSSQLCSDISVVGYPPSQPSQVHHCLITMPGAARAVRARRAARVSLTVKMNWVKNAIRATSYLPPVNMTAALKDVASAVYPTYLQAYSTVREANQQHSDFFAGTSGTSTTVTWTTREIYRAVPAAPIRVYEAPTGVAPPQPSSCGRGRRDARDQRVQRARSRSRSLRGRAPQRRVVVDRLQRHGVDSCATLPASSSAMKRPVSPSPVRTCRRKRLVSKTSPESSFIACELNASTLHLGSVGSAAPGTPRASSTTSASTDTLAACPHALSPPASSDTGYTSLATPAHRSSASSASTVSPRQHSTSSAMVGTFVPRRALAMTLTSSSSAPSTPPAAPVAASDAESTRMGVASDCDGPSNFADLLSTQFRALNLAVPNDQVQPHSAP